MLAQLFRCEFLKEGVESQLLLSISVEPRVTLLGVQFNIGCEGSQALPLPAVTAGQVFSALLREKPLPKPPFQGRGEAAKVPLLSWSQVEEDL